MDNVDKVATPQLNDNQHYALISDPEDGPNAHYKSFSLRFT